MAKRKRMTVAVEITFPAWMKLSDARREVRMLINNQSNYPAYGPDFQVLDEKTIRAVSVRQSA